MDYSSTWYLRYPEWLEGLPMPRIHDIYPKSIVYIYPTHDDADNSSPLGATGFICLVPYEMKIGDGNHAHAYIVTNEHAVRGDRSIRINTFDGGFDVVDVPKMNWIVHPEGDDLAVCAYHPKFRVHDIIGFPISWFVTKEYVKEREVGLGDDVFMVGRFQYHEGRKQNFPTVCFGSISQMPNEPILVQRSPDWTTQQEAFLVEMHSIRGFSGSPTFLYVTPATRFMTHVYSDATKYDLTLLGVDGGHLPSNDYIVDDNKQRIPHMRVQSNSAMTYVVPAWKLKELLDMPKLKDERTKAEQEFRDSLSDADVFGAAMQDSLEVEEQPPLTRTEFERILRKVSRPIQPPSDEEKSETSEYLPCLPILS